MFAPKNFLSKKISSTVLFLFLLLNFSCSKSEEIEVRSSENSEIASEQENKTVEDILPDDACLFEKNIPLKIALFGRSDKTLARILKDYGAIFVSRGKISEPSRIVFDSDDDCRLWQSAIETKREFFGGIEVELQPSAMDSLLAARDELRSKKQNFSVRGTWGGKRDFADTEKIWLTRINPGLNYWTAHGKLKKSEAEQIKSHPALQQIAEILALESKGIFFSKDFSKSVLYSATPPGASQHISMLAVDIAENGNANIRAVLAKHGWFQTVLSDLPHFTYLGAEEKDLPLLGLKKVIQNQRVFWIPDI